MLRRTALLACRSHGSSVGLEACLTCLTRQLLPDLSSSSTDSRSAWRREGGCQFSTSRTAAKGAPEDESDLPISPRVQTLAEEIMHLNLLEVADLTDILQKRLNIQQPSFGGMPFMGAAMPGAVPAAAEAPAAAPAAKEEEKTEFDVKLEGFDAAAKIKVIKEIRSITELGLKEAKELVEKSPVVVKTGLKKEEAEELKKKLEAVGGKVAVA